MQALGFQDDDYPLRVRTALPPRDRSDLEDAPDKQDGEQVLKPFKIHSQRPRLNTA